MTAGRTSRRMIHTMRQTSTAKAANPQITGLPTEVIAEEHFATVHPMSPFS